MPGSNTRDRSKIHQVIVVGDDGSNAGLTIDTTGLATDTGQQDVLVSIGAPADAPGSNTMLGLLKSINIEMSDNGPAATKEQPFTRVVTMVTGTPITPTAEGILVNCTSPGTVTFTNTNSDSFTLSFVAGSSKIEGVEFAGVTGTGGGFAGTVYGLRRA